MLLIDVSLIESNICKKFMAKMPPYPIFIIPTNSVQLKIESIHQPLGNLGPLMWGIISGMKTVSKDIFFFAVRALYVYYTNT